MIEPIAVKRLQLGAALVFCACFLVTGCAPRQASLQVALAYDPLDLSELLERETSASQFTVRLAAVEDERSNQTLGNEALPILGGDSESVLRWVRDGLDETHRGGVVFVDAGEASETSRPSVTVSVSKVSCAVTPMQLTGTVVLAVEHACDDTRKDFYRGTEAVQRGMFARHNKQFSAKTISKVLNHALTRSIAKLVDDIECEN